NEQPMRFRRGPDGRSDPRSIRLDLVGGAAKSVTGRPRSHTAFAGRRLPPDHRAGRRLGDAGVNDLCLALRQVWFINKAFLRNPASLFFTLIFPLMFLVIFSVIFV